MSKIKRKMYQEVEGEVRKRQQRRKWRRLEGGTEEGKGEEAEEGSK